MSAAKPLVLVTMGDPAGVGPEVAVRAVNAPSVRRVLRPLLLGAPATIRRTAEELGLSVEVCTVSSPAEATGRRGLLEVLPVAGAGVPRCRAGSVSPSVGPWVLGMLEQAADLAMRGEVEAITTAPICKEAVEARHKGFVGHTEFFAEQTGTRDYCMMLSTERLRLTFVTTHCALHAVTQYVTAHRIDVVVRLTYEAMTALGLDRPRVGVAALNPHAGESGLFGDEEQRVISRVVRTMAKRLPGLSGPHAPDAVFMKAYRGEYDAVVCMYHDQGHIPLKMIGFDEGVNTTLGLPIVRTSPDHGTAFDIAGQGVANPNSMRAALEMAARLALHRRRQRGDDG
jgi:4-hydroxythreonine-4-phosphate dehydrogenase